jgi:hypothetical protein
MEANHVGLRRLGGLPSAKATGYPGQQLCIARCLGVIAGQRQLVRSDVCQYRTREDVSTFLAARGSVQRLLFKRDGDLLDGHLRPAVCGRFKTVDGPFRCRPRIMRTFGCPDLDGLLGHDYLASDFPPDSILQITSTCRIPLTPTKVRYVSARSVLLRFTHQC